MKVKKTLFVISVFFLTLYSCYSDIDDCCGDGEANNPSGTNELFTPDQINPDNDPLSLGINDCGWDAFLSGKTIDYPIAQNLPEVYDVGYLMPEPRSQGTQGSCASWATNYYLATYMDNIVNDSIISSDQEIMSPSFAFNQIKANDGSNNCFGSSISANLSLLMNTGALSIATFPYDENSCSIQPDMNQLNNANSNLISSYENIGPYIINDSLTQESIVASSLNEVKSALFDGRPVIVSMLVDVDFGRHRINDLFFVSEIDEDSFRGCHAMTIVGYNDDLNAFRVINSWGNAWANSGYVYVSYDFFLESTNTDYQKGVLQLTVAFND